MCRRESWLPSGRIARRVAYAVSGEPCSTPSIENGRIRPEANKAWLSGSAGKRISGFGSQTSTSVVALARRAETPEPQVSVNSAEPMVKRGWAPKNSTSPASTSASSCWERNSGGPEPTICPKAMICDSVGVAESAMNFPWLPAIPTCLRQEANTHKAALIGELEPFRASSISRAIASATCCVDSTRGCKYGCRLQISVVCRANTPLRPCGSNNTYTGVESSTVLMSSVLVRIDSGATRESVA